MSFESVIYSIPLMRIPNAQFSEKKTKKQKNQWNKNFKMSFFAPSKN